MFFGKIAKLWATFYSTESVALIYSLSERFP
jgi:hypothetical protein